MSVLPPLVGLLGGGNQAREIRAFLPTGTATFVAVDAAYVGDDAVDVTAPSDAQRAAEVLVAVGGPALKQHLVAQWPGTSYAVLVADGAHVSPGNAIGRGTVVAPGAVLTTSISIGEHVLVNVGATISHDCVVGDFTTIGPGAHLTGRVRLGAGCFVGAGATILPGVTLAEGVVVGAGAVVREDVVEPCAVVAGVPSRLLRVEPGWLREA